MPKQKLTDAVSDLLKGCERQARALLKAAGTSRAKAEKAADTADHFDKPASVAVRMLRAIDNVRAGINPLLSMLTVGFYLERLEGVARKRGRRKSMRDELIAEEFWRIKKADKYMPHKAIYSAIAEQWDIRPRTAQYVVDQSRKRKK